MKSKNFCFVKWYFINLRFFIKCHFTKSCVYVLNAWAETKNKVPLHLLMKWYFLTYILVGLFFFVIPHVQ